MIRIVAALLLIAALVPDATFAATSDEGVSYPLSLTRGSRLLIAAKINGLPVAALLDSAAEATIIDQRLARKLGLGQGAAVVGQGSGEASFQAALVGGVTLEALGLSLRDRTVAVTDLSDVGRRLLRHRVDVILGREIFDAARLLIDIERRRIVVLGRDHEPHGVRLDLVTENGVETIPVRVESGPPVRATFDLGNGSRMMIGSTLATQMKLLSDGRKVSFARGGGLGGETRQQIITLRTIDIAGRLFQNVEATIDRHSSASDLNIGVSELRHFWITTDFANHAVWLDFRK